MTDTRRQWRARVRRRVACGLLIVVAGSLSVGAKPALAGPAPVGSLYLDGLLAATTTGSAMPFTASLTNDGPNRVVSLRLVLRVSATGVDPQGLKVERRDLDGTWDVVANRTGNRGDVTFVDESYQDRSMEIGGALTGRYRLTFLAGAPPGPAVVAAVAHHRTENQWQSLAYSPQYLTTVVASAGAGGGAVVAASGVPAGGGQRTSSPQTGASPAAPSPAATIGVEVNPGTGGSRLAVAVGTARLSRPVVSRRSTMVGMALVMILLVAAAGLLRYQVMGGTPAQSEPESDHGATDASR